MSEPPTRRRKLSKEEIEAGRHILQSLPRDLIIHLLKTTNLPIPDVIHFCETDKWAFDLCHKEGNNIWNEVYQERFADKELRAQVEQILRRDIWLKDPVTKLSVQLRFERVYVQLVNIINNHRHIVIGTAARREAISRAVKIISSIYGPNDPYINDRFMWLHRFEDTMIASSVFRKMLLYSFLQHGYTVESTSGGTEGILCNVCTAHSVSNMCSDCNVPICGSVCFGKHECILYLGTLDILRHMNLP